MPNLYNHSEPGCQSTVLFGTLPLVLTYLSFVHEINPSFDVFNIFIVIIWRTVQEFVWVSFENTSFLCFDTLFGWLLAFPSSNLPPPPKKKNWSKNNRKISITKEICITIDSPKKSLEESQTPRQVVYLKISLRNRVNLWNFWRQVPVIMECHSPPDIDKNGYNVWIGLKLCDFEDCTLQLRFYEISAELIIFGLQYSASNFGNPPLWTSLWRFVNGSIGILHLVDVITFPTQLNNFHWRHSIDVISRKLLCFRWRISHQDLSMVGKKTYLGLQWWFKSLTAEGNKLCFKNEPKAGDRRDQM